MILLLRGVPVRRIKVEILLYSSFYLKESIENKGVKRYNVEYTYFFNFTYIYLFKIIRRLFMKLNTIIEEKTCTIAIEGSIDALAAQELEQAVNDAAPQCEKMILDMSQVDYISSGGLRAVVGANHTVGKGNLVLRGLAPNVLEIFRLTGFTKYLIIE